VTAGPAPVVGASLVGIGVLHVAATGAFYPESVRSIVQGRVLGAVEADPELAAVRGVGFWYATAGLGVIALGHAVGQVERAGRLRIDTAAVLAGIGAWGVSLMPKSGFWLFFPVAALAAVRARASRVRG
jgi:hypothetical protein